MDDLLARLVAASPIAAALIAMSWQFLKYMKVRDTEWAQTVKIMSEKQTQAHETCTITVKENTLMMGQVKQLLETRIRQAGG